jgi:hypothetical protein
MVIITRSCCRVALSSLLLCAAGSAMAEDSGFYIGLDEGWVKYPNAAVREIGTTTLAGTGLSDTNFTWDFTAGYRFDHYLSVEAGYADLGGRSGLVRGSSGDTGALGNVSFSAKGETLVLIGTLPFGRWDASLKAGILRADSYLGFSGIVSNESYESHIKVFNKHPLYGAGLGYNIDSHWRAQFGFTAYREVGSTDSISRFRVVGPNVSTLTVGILYQF